MEKYCFWILFYIILSLLINKLSTALNKTGCLFGLPVMEINLYNLVTHNIAEIQNALLKLVLNTNQ
jgi:hypothetical protein